MFVHVCFVVVPCGSWDPVQLLVRNASNQDEVTNAYAVLVASEVLVAGLVWQLWKRRLKGIRRRLEASKRVDDWGGVASVEMTATSTVMFDNPVAAVKGREDKRTPETDGSGAMPLVAALAENVVDAEGTPGSSSSSSSSSTATATATVPSRARRSSILEVNHANWTWKQASSKFFFTDPAMFTVCVMGGLLFSLLTVYQTRLRERAGLL